MLGESGKDPRVIMPIESNAQYVDPGTLVFAKGGALVAQSFNASTGQLAGEPFAIAESVRFFLRQLPPISPRRRTDRWCFSLMSIDRGWHGSTGPGASSGPSARQGLSRRAHRPAGQAALASRTLPATGTFDIWSFDLDRGTETRVTLDDAFTEIEGITAPGGDAMVFAAARGTPPRLVRRDLRTGHDEPLVPQGLLMQGADDVSPDGRRLAYEERTDKGGFNLWTLSLTGPVTPTRIRQSPFNETSFRFAPDGDHYTFTSDESGRPEVYVSVFAAGKTVVSNGGGFDARWSRDGREIVYVSSDLRMMAVPVRKAPAVELGKPSTLFAITNNDGFPSTWRLTANASS